MAVKKRRLAFIIALIVIGIFALASALKIFEEDPGYSVVPHGNHNHYVPHDRDPAVPLHNFPQRPPREGERIMPDGRLVRVDEDGNPVQ